MGVLILAEERDPCADAMVPLLQDRGIDVDRTDLAWFPHAVGVDARLRNGSWSGCLQVHERQIDLESISAVWYRSPATFRFPAGLTTAERAHAAVEAKMGLGGILLSLPALWVNRPDLAATASYKPLQMRVAAVAGLTVADTLITSRAEPVAGFVADHAGSGGTVTKMFASNSIVEAGRRAVAFTRAVESGDLADLTGIDVTTHQFQARVHPKLFDARVIVIGARLFGFAIDAATEQARLDFRRDYRALSYARVEMPLQVESGIRRLCLELGLQYAAIDFAVRPDGEWVFLGDVNPGGQYAWLEAETGAPLTAALADLLMSAVPGHRHEEAATSDSSRATVFGAPAMEGCSR